MNESQLRFLQAVLHLNKCIFLFILFIIQFILSILGEIFHWTGLAFLFLESNTIGGAFFSDLLFVEPSRWLEKIMKKIASIAVVVSGTKI